MKNSFRGENGLRNYLDPQNATTPLVEIPRALNPFYDDGVRICLKMMSTTPLGNVKSLPAWNMLSDAHQNGELAGVQALIENSSGNTVFSLGILARLHGIETTTAIVSHQISHGKLNLLRFFGIEPFVNREEICPDPADPASGIYQAKKRAAADPKLFNPGQYDNRSNPEIHEKITGPQIWEQMEQNLQIFCAGLGTTGTMVGISKFLRKQNPDIFLLGVARTKNNPVPGPRTLNLLEEIAFDWRDACDEIVEVGTVESYRHSLQLCRQGLLVGPSTGFSLAGLLQKLADLKKHNQLDQYRQDNGLINAATVACDTPFIYLDEYFFYLNEQDFPEIKNRELLENLGAIPENNDEYEIEIADFTKEAFGKTVAEIQVLPVEAIEPQPGVLLFDIRSRESYEHFHLPHSEWISDYELSLRDLSGKKVFLICHGGAKSLEVVSELREKGVQAWSVAGGLIEWSQLDLPRHKAEVCRRE